MTTVFVTATGTEVGKTVVVRGLIKALRAQGRAVEALKPVVSGYDPH
ncbi:MAG: AAA family ATPase, partial [Rhodoplanes sp.]